MSRPAPAQPLGVLAALTGLLWAVPGAAWAHGIAVRGDLPLPVWMVAYGAAAVLVLSFVALGVLWPEPRLEGGSDGLALPRPVEQLLAGLAWPARLAALVSFGVVWVVALAGPLSPPRNLAPFAVYVVLWVGGLVVSGLVGDVWRVASPFETLARAAGVRTSHPEQAPAPLNRLGVWPAAGLLLAFTWLELVHPAPAEPRTIGIAITVYVAVIAVGAAWWGRAWVYSAEAFGALFRLLAAMAPFHRDTAGRLRLRPPLAGLAALDPEPGTAALVLVALGSTTFDGMTRLSWWERLLGPRTGWAAVPYGTAGLLLTVAAVSGVYLWAMREAADDTARTTGELVGAFVHSLVPIALAYAIAHYFSLLVFEGQRVLSLASDPFARGWNLFGTAEWTVNYTTISPAAIAWVQAGAILAGHLAGVLLAHDRAVALFDRKLAARSQQALLVAMVAYTVGGLLLLLGG